MVLVALAVIACDTESSRRNPVGPAAPGTPSALIVRLELNGPDTIHINEATQFTVTAVKSDGSTEDVTSQASWNAFPPSFMAMSGAGLFTGTASGEPRLVAAVAERSAMKNLIVVPPGTYRLRGTIRDAGVPVTAHVRIESPSFGDNADKPSAMPTNGIVRLGEAPRRALIDRRFKLIAGEEAELYDLDRDPFEAQNLLLSRLQTMTAMQARLADLTQCEERAGAAMQVPPADVRARLAALGYTSRAAGHVH